MKAVGIIRTGGAYCWSLVGPTQVEMTYMFQAVDGCSFLSVKIPQSASTNAPGPSPLHLGCTISWG